MLTSLHLHKEIKEVCIKTRSPAKLKLKPDNSATTVKSSITIPKHTALFIGSDNEGILTFPSERSNTKPNDILVVDKCCLSSYISNTLLQHSNQLNLAPNFL